MVKHATKNTAIIINTKMVKYTKLVSSDFTKATPHEVL